LPLQLLYPPNQALDNGVSLAYFLLELFDGRFARLGVRCH
jgi:hypothetical protein